MTEMSVILPRLGHIQRKTYLEEHYGIATNKEIALACGVHESTITRDIAAWKNSGEYDEWLDRRWHEYLESDAVDDRTKFLALTRLKEKRMTQESKAKTGMRAIKHGIDITVLKRYRYIIQEIISDSGEPVHPDEAPSDDG